MYSTRKRFVPYALTLLRVVVGVVLIAHGVDKLADPAGSAAFFAQAGVPAPRLAVWLAIAGELGGGIGLLVGLLTPLAALGAALVMASAIFTVHLGKGLFASNGGWEFPLVMMLVALFFVVRGGGPFSLDTVIERERMRSRGDDPARSRHEAELRA